MTIRQATPEDFDAIYSLVKTAFQTAKVSDGGEQDFVLKLRKGSYIPELELGRRRGRRTHRSHHADRSIHP